MMKKLLFALPLTALVAACGGGGSGGDAAATSIKAVGSSTVYPFTTAVGEQFDRANPDVSVIVESTGTGSGMKLFCEGLGADLPDLANASRRMKTSEFNDCQEAGVTDIIEMPIGIDGLTLIQASSEEPFALTLEQVYEALAANPYGEEQTAMNWSDIDPSLPNKAIRVLGPPPTSGTRDSFVELIMEVGCDRNPQMAALEEADEDRHAEVCSKMREDGVFVEAGENDNLMVQKVSNDPGTVGILGYSFFEENTDKLQALALDGVTPDEDSISSLEYPGARMLYVYVKDQHIEVKPALLDFVNAYKAAWQPGGLLRERGLVPLNDEGRAAADAAVDNRTKLTAEQLN